jgi:predicted enzyme related to lactoylglutathione lyase
MSDTLSSFHFYDDALGVRRVAIRYSNDTEEDRPATSLEDKLERENAELQTVIGELKSEQERYISFTDIERQIDHIEKNGGDLKHMPGMTDEGRCRELCAMYLREFIINKKMKQHIDALARAKP